MKAADWIDRVKAARGWDSDYRVAKELGLGRQTVSTYRNRPSTMDDEAAIKVATALGERPEIVLLDQIAERTKSETARSALSEALRRLGGVAASILLATGMTVFPNGNNALAQSHADQNDIHRRS